jgi:hypothetical protein
MALLFENSIIMLSKITPLGFNRLVRLGRIDLSVEALVTSEKYKELEYFTPKDRQKAAERLQSLLR